MPLPPDHRSPPPSLADPTTPPLDPLPLPPEGQVYPVPGASPVPGYRLVRRLGRGGFSEVWEATGPQGRRCALKFVHSEAWAVKFEARSLDVMKDVAHPHVLRIFQNLRQGDSLIIEMDLADRSLNDRLNEALRAGEGGIPRDELWRYLAGVAEGLDHLNGRGIRHRDVKPDNLLLKGDVALVADFSMAKSVQHTHASHTTGVMTAAYAPPEFFGTGAKDTPWSDQYSLAVTYCKLRGNRLPFGDGWPTRVVERDLTMLPEVERPLVDLALREEPHDRWPDCRSFIEALAATADDHRPARVANFLGMTFARIPPGSFLMGSPLGEAGREPYKGADETRHRVTLTKGCFLGVHTVTRGQFARFVEASGYKTEAETPGGAPSRTGKGWQLDPGKNWRTPGFDQTDAHPVVCVSWNDAVAFCAWLTRQDGQGRRYRLPTEAEWEYACRAGTTTAYPWGERLEDGEGWCNIADLTAKKVFPDWTAAPWEGGYVYTSPVGVFWPNAWGLYDVIGNVWEWCADGFGPYPTGAVRDPKGPEKGKDRVLRGGSWRDSARYCRAAYRRRSPPSHRSNDYVGCRVVFGFD